MGQMYPDRGIAVITGSSTGSTKVGWATVVTEGAAARIWSSLSGESVRRTRVLRAKRVASVGVEYMTVPSIVGMG